MNEISTNPAMDAYGFRVLEVQGLGEPYAFERFATPYLFHDRGQAQGIADALNRAFNPHGLGVVTWTVVPGNQRIRVDPRSLSPATSQAK